MSNSKLNVAAVSVFGSAKNVHYAVSTFAAVVYALVWLLTGRAQAETTAIGVASNDTIPEFVITAEREKSVDGLQEIVVWGTRESTEKVADLPEFIVWGEREQIVASNSTPSGGSFGTSAKTDGRWTAKVRHWLKLELMR